MFNLDQREGLDLAQGDQNGSGFEPLQSAEEIVEAYARRPKIRHGQAIAYYSPEGELINVPLKKYFAREEAYDSTLFHELTRSTGHPSRLNRKGIVDLCPFGSTNYSKEELIAEMGATFLYAHSGIETRTIDNSTLNIQSWIERFIDNH